MKNSDLIQGLTAALDPGRPFTAVAVVEEELSRDGTVNRLLKRGSVRADTVPFPLLSSHDRGDNQKVVGRVDVFRKLSTIDDPTLTERIFQESPNVADADPDLVWIAEGYLATNEEGLSASDMVEQRMLRGVSVGGGQFEKQDNIEPVEGSEEDFFPEMEGTIEFEEFQVVELSIASVQALESAVIWLSDTDFVDVPEQENGEEAIVASVGEPAKSLNSYPVFPDPSFFSEQSLPDIIPNHITVTDEGHLYCYLGKYDTPHTGYVDSPRFMPREPDYRFFHLKNVKTSDGKAVKTGTILMRTSHVDVRLPGPDALKKYENSGYAVADVRAIPKHDGVVLTGAVRSTISPEDVRELMGSSLSGDWRRDPISKQKRLHAVTAVNSPGFPVAEPIGHDHALVASIPFIESEMALVASFMDSDKDISSKVAELEQRVISLDNKQQVESLKRELKEFYL